MNRSWDHGPYGPSLTMSWIGLNIAIIKPTTERRLALEPKRLQYWISDLKFGTRCGSKYVIKYATKSQIKSYLDIGILVTKSAVLCLGFSTTPRRRHINTTPLCNCGTLQHRQTKGYAPFSNRYARETAGTVDSSQIKIPKRREREVSTSKKALHSCAVILSCSQTQSDAKIINSPIYFTHWS